MSRTRALFSAFALSVALPACSSIGTVSVAGSFEPPAAAPGQIRYMLHPDYGQNVMDRAFGTQHTGHGDYASIFPDASGAFEGPREQVYYHSPPLKTPPPTYWLSFSNEKAVVYAVGWGDGGFDYRALDSKSYAVLDRTKTCWVVTSGEFVYPPEGQDREVQLKIALAHNSIVPACPDAPE